MSNFAFNNVPVIRHSRSRQDLSHTVKTAGNVGTLYPFEVQEVYPGDTFKVNTTVVSRLTSEFKRPVMDNLFLDVYYFFVPDRLLYDKFVNIFGENTESAYANIQEYEVPVVNGAVPSGSVGDFLGLPVGMPLEGISVLPFRAFAKVYNEWFRDQNNVDPMHLQTGEVVASESPNSNDWSPANYFGLPPKVAKMHDYFTSALPSPQKGNAPEIGIANFSDVPVEGSASIYSNSGAPLVRTEWGSTTLSSITGFVPAFSATNRTLLANPTGGVTPTANEVNPRLGVTLNDLTAKTSELSLTPITVNDLRFAFQYQRMLEKDARGGSRYVEMLANHYNIQAGDYRLQRSEFLGGRRTPISIHQVTQSTGAGSESSPLGAVGAYSLSNGRSRFTKGFVEHGFVIGVYCIRQFHSYQQGVERFWKRKKRSDFYDPVFAHIGEQPVYKTQLYGSADPEEVFGYQEAWADLRSRTAHITGKMRSGVTDSLDVWHFGDQYSNAPTLGKDFIEETPIYVDRAITVPSESQPQFILDFYIQNIAYRAMPTYSVPGLIDHD